MRHRKGRKKLVPTIREHKGLMVNLLKALFKHEEIKTTEARAKELRRVAEHLITVARKGDIHSRRQIFSAVRDKLTTSNLLDSIAPRFTERKGGYTQAIKLGGRRGDGAPMVLVKLLKKSGKPGKPEKPQK